MDSIAELYAFIYKHLPSRVQFKYAPYKCVVDLP